MLAPECPLSLGWYEVLPCWALPCRDRGSPKSPPTPRGSTHHVPCAFHTPSPVEHHGSSTPTWGTKPQSRWVTAPSQAAAQRQNVGPSDSKPVSSPVSVMVLKSRCLLSRQLLASIVSFSRNPLKLSYSSAGLCLFTKVRIHRNSTPLCHHSDHPSQDEQLPPFKIQGHRAWLLNVFHQSLWPITLCWAFLAAHRLLSSCGSRASRLAASLAVEIQARGLRKL